MCLWALLGSLGFARPLWVLGSSGSLWASQGLSGPRCTSLGLSWPPWASLCFSGHFRTSLSLFGSLWGSLGFYGTVDLAGPRRGSLGPSGPLGLSGPLRACLGISGAHLGFFGTLRISLGLLGVLWDSMYEPFWASLILSGPLRDFPPWASLNVSGPPWASPTLRTSLGLSETPPSLSLIVWVCFCLFLPVW